MEFGIEKCAGLIRRSRKCQMTQGIEPPNQEKIRTLGEKENYTYLGILEEKMKENYLKAYLGRTRKRLVTKTI